VKAGLAPATFAQKRTLVELLIDRVLVTNSDVEIRYAIPTHPRGEMTRFCQFVKTIFTILLRCFTCWMMIAVSWASLYPRMAAEVTSLALMVIALRMP
jgi:hypothetical protein